MIYLLRSEFSQTVDIHLLLLQFHGPLSGTTRVNRYQKKNSPTDTSLGRWSSFICFLHLYSILPIQFMYLTVFLRNLCPRSSLVYLLVWHPSLHTPYISSPNHCLLFVIHAHINATRFAIVLRLCYPASVVYGFCSCFFSLSNKLDFSCHLIFVNESL